MREMCCLGRDTKARGMRTAPRKPTVRRTFNRWRDGGTQVQKVARRTGTQWCPSPCAHIHNCVSGNFVCSLHTVGRSGGRAVGRSVGLSLARSAGLSFGCLNRQRAIVVCEPLPKLVCNAIGGGGSCSVQPTDYQVTTA